MQNIWFISQQCFSKLCIGSTGNKTFLELISILFPSLYVKRIVLTCRCETDFKSQTFYTNLFVVLDFIVEDNAVGSFWLHPGQRDTVSGRLLLPDHCYRRGSWVGDMDTVKQRKTLVKVTTTHWFSSSKYRMNDRF